VYDPSPYQQQPNENDSLVIAIKQEVKYRFHAAAMLPYILQERKLHDFKDLLPYII
jgi:hypothetical protein